MRLSARVSEELGAIEVFILLVGHTLHCIVVTVFAHPGIDLHALLSILCELRTKVS